MLTVEQALTKLSEYGITSSIQMVRRWLRNGVIQGERTENRKEGWRIPPDELDRFIQSRNVTPKQDFVDYPRRSAEECWEIHLENICKYGGGVPTFR